MTVFKLDDYKELFANHDNYMIFVRDFKIKARQNFVPLLASGKVVGCLMNVGFTKKILTERLVDRAMSDPELLTKVLE